MYVLALSLCFLCWLASVRGQKSYYCSSPDPITDIDFFVVTRQKNSEYYQPLWKLSMGSACTFSVAPTPGFFFITVEWNDLRNHEPQIQLTTLTGGGASKIFDWSFKDPLESYKREVVTAADSGIAVVFETSQNYGDSPVTGAGVKLRFQFFNKTACPPAWVMVKGICVGPGQKQMLSYEDAQASCTWMRANLYADTNWLSIQNVSRLLSGRISGAWLGINDIGSRGDYRMLNGESFPLPGQISCSDLPMETPDCSRLAPCVFLKVSSRGGGYLRLDDCFNTREYLCAMPPGGAPTFYSVPNYSRERMSNLIIAVIVVVILVCLAGCGVLTFLLLRHFRTRRNSSPTSKEIPLNDKSSNKPNLSPDPDVVPLRHSPTNAETA